MTDAIAAIMTVEDNAGSVATALEDPTPVDADKADMAAIPTTAIPTVLDQQVAIAALVAIGPVATNAPNVAATATTTTMEAQHGVAGAAEAIMEIMDGEMEELLFVPEVLNLQQIQEVMRQWSFNITAM